MNEENPNFRLVIKFKDHLNLPYHEPDEISRYFCRNDLFPFKSHLQDFPGLRINKLFTTLGPDIISELTNKAGRLDKGYTTRDFLSYYAVDCPPQIFKDELLDILRRHDKVEMAYVESGPAISPSSITTDIPTLVHQGYLKHSPTGIDAEYAWNIAGGDGSGQVKFIDIEQGWDLNSQNFSVGTFPFTGMNLPVFKDHGKAVLEIILSQHRFIAGKGIAPKANGYIISQWRPDGFLNTSDAIMAALAQLEFGDIILLEAQICDSPKSESFWPVEIQNAVFDVIRLASALGIIVIEAAGNGKKISGDGNDLDSFTDFNGSNPLDRSGPDFRDSGAILVAAGSDTVPHTKIKHSNFGRRIDCYAWGERVSIAGYQFDSSEMAIDLFRKKLNGTSGAAAIIAGAAILVQSITESNYHFRLGPAQMRQILSSDLLGTTSINGRIVDKIGVMPDLRKIINYIPIA